MSVYILHYSTSRYSVPVYVTDSTSYDIALLLSTIQSLKVKFLRVILTCFYVPKCTQMWLCWLLNLGCYQHNFFKNQINTENPYINSNWLMTLMMPKMEKQPIKIPINIFESLSWTKVSCHLYFKSFCLLRLLFWLQSSIIFWELFIIIKNDTICHRFWF